MGELDKFLFADRIASLKQAVSVQGKVYHSISVEQGKVKFIRQGKTRTENIDLEELYSLFKNVSHPTNQEARAYISGRVQSPAVSIINSLDMERDQLLRHKRPAQKVSSTTIKNRLKSIKKSHTPPENQKDETRFFQILGELLGHDYLLSKSIGKPISSSEVFLSDDYRTYDFTESVEDCLDAILKALQSNYAFSSKSLSHFVDGLLINHPTLGTRIVEFDEEQHFTPALSTTLAHQSKVTAFPFLKLYQDILSDMDYLNDAVFTKHRMKNKVKELPESFSSFQHWLESVDERESGYIKPKDNGFPFLGGRIAQRAYFDGLRNVAHLSPKNKDFQPAIRFPKKYFEDTTDMKFSRIDNPQLMKVIRQYLTDEYGKEI